MSEGGMAITEPILPGQDAASQLSAPFESDARPTVVNEPAADTQSAGSSAVAERSTKPIYLPVRTLSSVSHQAEALEGCELKAYKLGKKRWLYNECRISLRSVSGCFRNLQIKEATRMVEEVLAPELMDCGVAYTINLKNGQRLDMEVYLAFDQPELMDPGTEPDLDAVKYYRGMHLQGNQGFRWPAVQRRRCAKGCVGPILRPIQRFGRLSRRTDKKLAPQENSHDQPKDLSCLYLSCDEATNHVGGTRFRLIAALFDLDRNCLSTCCSAPILVLANNDAPNGPACINLDLAINDSWEGWPKAEMDSDYGDVHPRNLSTDSIQQDHYRLDSAGPSGSTRFSAPASLLESRSTHAMAFIRERALQEDPEEEAAYEEAPNKRQCATYLRAVDLPREMFQHPPALPLSRMDAPFLTEDRIRINAPLRGMTDMDNRNLRHDSLSDSSMHYSMPHLNMVRSHSSNSRACEAGMGAMRFSSMPGPGALLSELQAQRAMDSNEGGPEFWSQRLHGQMHVHMLPPQGSTLRQESSPAAMINLSRDSEGFHSSWGSAASVQRAQNPTQLPAYQHTVFANPFAQPAESRQEMQWIQNMRAQSTDQGNNRS